MTALQLSNVSKAFGSVDVLRDINISVEEGEFVVFVGPSGCGKSTLLRVIAGLEDASAGDVSIGGQRMNATPPSKRGIAMVFQSYALYPHLTVRGNMTLALKQERQSKDVIDARVTKASAMLNLQDYLHRYPSELSGGQRQRVAIGRAIVREPKLFLFDEPLSNLDAALRMNTRLEIASLHKALSASMIYVTHDQTEAMTLADKIVVLRDGRVEQIGSPMELYNNPANQFVAGFLGAPSMNFIPGAYLQPSDPRVLGIRPEDLRVAEDGELAAQVLHVEQLGGDTNVVAQFQDLQITARLFGQHAIAEGAAITFGIAPDRRYYFDKGGARLR
ncbi:MAG: ABC transporter ATP-binding protein [Pseudomonadota bacterium]